ncbi:MAG: pyruvate kinase [Gammaproteobacteria bacterium TMED278]|jgi:pyruvate kinase|nr:pyruvate kinase [Gammaproteobacteria bacterium]OUX41728.1 MAG: pyruvate kinase [Gammaproteobacteria bacterium TMED278]RCL35485.1 MAG: pyruvate kinase [SAR86 cluster bacterium]|tara:strand:+ start:1466 stop:2878 length:1413 start_codon:yes stop_codon:yes gene_type:complete
MTFSRTKIICTIGPATKDLKTLKNLYNNGMNVARINMSHADHRSAKSIIDRIHKINADPKSRFGPIGILLDTQGPEIRTGDTNITQDLKVGDEVTLTVRDQVDVETSSIKINYKDLIESVNPGSKISVDNGLINFKVLKKESETLLCKVLDGGKLGSKRHVNLPGVRINLPSITSKDMDDINFGIKNKVDFIALSFVRDKEDLKKLQQILDKKKSYAKIIAKIENQDGLDNINDICKFSWGVMVARGDLGIETSLTDLPNIQRKIMHACAKWGRRSIVATHLLESMISNPTPTRAEVSDIANAIYEGADAIMLSGETSIGKYPKECVQFLKSIAIKTEKFPTLGYEKNLISTTDWEHIGVAAKNLAEATNADGIIAITRTGNTATYVANAKPNGIPIYTFTNNKDTYKKLSLVGSSYSYMIGSLKDHDKTLNKVIKILKNKYDKKTKLKFILASGIFSEEHSEAIQIINI